jgi:hypothetical protein
LVAALPLVAAKRPKTDILYSKNGDRITCEIVRMEHRYLHVKMPYTKGTVTINCQEVARLASSKLFVLESSNGGYYEGSITSDAAQDNSRALRRRLITLPSTDLFRFPLRRCSLPRTKRSTRAASMPI